MKLKEKISLEKVFEKEYKIKLVELESNKEAIITHFLHNSKNGISQFFKKDAVKYAKEILQYHYPDTEISNIVAEEALQYGIFDTVEVPFPPIETTTRHSLSLINSFSIIYYKYILKLEPTLCP